MCFYFVSQFVDAEGLVNMVTQNIRISEVIFHRSLVIEKHKGCGPFKVFSTV